MNLVKSNVVFDEINHKYSINGKELSGITNAINKLICPNKYQGIPKYILEKAALHGTEIHKLCESAVLNSLENPFPPVEVQNFIDKVMPEYSFAECEYLVSDNVNFASCIDLVDINNNLFDIKTTVNIDKEYLQWQLSIYAYLFELQNPGVKAGKLYGIHLKENKCSVFELERISDDNVKYLLDCYINDLPFTNPIKANITKIDREILRVRDIENTIISYKEYIKNLEDVKKNVTDYFIEEMKKNNIKSFESSNGLIKLTYVEPYERVSIDSKKLKEDMPDVYDKYSKTTNVKESIKITIRNE